ncbi:hypothetical protein C4566_02860 [Candidatus Parcubacteria bacterium]|nr:MAG: hypothetical protein C4566_02860 [Candidatus Parcubacteria bacterium]
MQVGRSLEVHDPGGPDLVGGAAVGFVLGIQVEGQDQPVAAERGDGAQVVVDAPEGLERVVAGFLHVAEQAERVVAEGDGVPAEPEVVDGVVLALLPHGVAVPADLADFEAEGDVVVEVAQILGLVVARGFRADVGGLVDHRHDARAEAELDVDEGAILADGPLVVVAPGGADLGTDVGPGIRLEVAPGGAGADEEVALGVGLDRQVLGLGRRRGEGDETDGHEQQTDEGGEADNDESLALVHETLPPVR